MAKRKIRFTGLLCNILVIMVLNIGHQSESQNLSRVRGNMSEGFRLSARLESNQVKLREPVLLVLSIKNVSKSVLYLEETLPEKEYELDVRDSRGTSVKLTETGQRLLANKNIDFRLKGVKIEPQQEQVEKLDISSLRDISAPGTYFVKATRRVKKLHGDGWTDLASNTVQVRITQ